MSFNQFSEDQYIKVFDTGETVRVGTFQTNEQTELSNMYTGIYIKDTDSLGGTEKLRMHVHADPGYDGDYAVSEWINISDITTTFETGKGWIGWLLFDFSRQNINPSNTYYVSIEIGNYTRNGDTFYIGILRDFPATVYDNSEDLFYDHPMVMSIFGYRK